MKCYVYENHQDWFLGFSDFERLKKDKRFLTVPQKEFYGKPTKRSCRVRHKTDLRNYEYKSTEKYDTLTLGILEMSALEKKGYCSLKEINLELRLEEDERLESFV